MKPLLRCAWVVLLTATTQAVFAQLTTAPDGGNKRATVSEQIGLTEVAITYNRPAVKGREGQVYGTNVAHYGFKDLGFGTSKAAPWRAGANENTTIAFSTDVKVEGKDLAAGKYGLFMALEDGATTVIFSKNSNSWGSYFYDPAEDALRVNVKTVKLNESTERLSYTFTDQTENSATVALVWEKLKVPFKIESDLVKTQLASFRQELRTDKGFAWQAWTQAANFCADHNTNLPEALNWANTAISGTFIGQKNFTTLRTKARILELTGQTAEAAALMKEALPMGGVTEIHQYARQLIAMKQPKEALSVFQMNAKKNPNEFTTTMGLVRGYSATGDYKNALKFAKAALPKAPDPNNRAALESMIKTLEQGKDVN